MHIIMKPIVKGNNIMISEFELTYSWFDLFMFWLSALLRFNSLLHSVSRLLDAILVQNQAFSGTGVR
jgi:hypothetical protein